MATMSDPVIIDKVPNLRVALLNRPDKLNALNLPMVRALMPNYQNWNIDPSVRAIVLQGLGDKAFCAGGDIISLLDPKNADLRRDFFREEYQLNYLIHNLQVPHIALLDGITMGGGVGLSVHGRYRVATERTLFAMPETAIGFFPDVGGSYFLPRLPVPGLGMWLALTGSRLRSWDLLHAGIATHFVPSGQLNQLIAELSNQGPRTEEDLESIFELCGDDVSALPSPSWQPSLSFLPPIFTLKSVPEIITALKGNTESAWCQEQLKLLSKMSPLSLLVTFEQLKRGAQLDMAGCLKMEYNLSQRFMEDSDFFEGVTALKEKRAPVWKHKSVEEVKPSEVERFFVPLPAEQQWAPAPSVQHRF
eukprot:TRINITY_DN9709_c0_g1_i2.p1 TRINITY_DN9709_c0_g1~~TRINITY_DN9709_c0_g1_i2.p1  ORF type:complete len:382 (-),score=87.94 TRINITY_DN9709_c0_g1_i2:12-1097(-)